MTEDYVKDFGPFEGVTWLNCAHQGALPRVAVAEAKEAIVWKRAPWNLTTERFSSVPQRLREALGRLINAPAEEIILGNSASYGLHLLANGIRWQAGDEVLLMHGDFPSDILPWLALEQRGVAVRLIRPRGAVLQPEELSHKDPERNSAVHEELRNRKIFFAQRAGKLRVSPHLYNTPEDIDHALSVLNSI